MSKPERMRLVNLNKEEANELYKVRCSAHQGSWLCAIGERRGRARKRVCPTGTARYVSG